jgi:hypothetical protein
MSSTIIWLLSLLFSYPNTFLYVHRAKKADFAPSHKQNFDRLLKFSYWNNFLEEKNPEKKTIFLVNHIFKAFYFLSFN